MKKHRKQIKHFPVWNMNKPACDKAEAQHSGKSENHHADQNRTREIAKNKVKEQVQDWQYNF